MRSIRSSFLIIILISFSGNLICQDVVAVLDRIYGPDQTLFNGKKYTYYPPPGTERHQYLFSPDFVEGSVTIKGKNYNDVTLNYDIFNQQLLLQFPDKNGPRNRIEVSKARLESFRLGNMNFEYLKLEKEPRFFQVLGQSPVQILYYWRKNLDVNGIIGSYHLTFTRAVRDSFILKDGQLKPFNTKRKLITLFDPGIRPEIKSYLRKNKVNVKKASDRVIEEMLVFIANLK